MIRHYWQGAKGNQKCKNCKMKKIIKLAPAKKIIDGNKKVMRTFYQAQGGKLEQLDTPPACNA